MAGSDLVCDWCDDDSLISQTVRSRRCFTHIVPAILHKNMAYCMLGPYLRVHVWLNNNTIILTMFENMSIFCYSLLRGVGGGGALIYNKVPKDEKGQYS
jgi:hypothetical protein